jgi:DUF4097 and DUF4098 domain-containing protein YvlB
MNTNIRHLAVFFLFGGLLLLSTTDLAVAAEYEANLDRSFSISGPAKLNIDADRGSITVKTDSTDKVQVLVFRKIKGGSQEKADEHFKNHEVTFSQDGNNISIVAKNKKIQRSFTFADAGLEVRYEIIAPRKLDVDLKTSGGNIVVGDVDGQVLARTSSGEIKLSHVSGTVNAADSGGNISIEEVGGTLVTKTSSGSITVGKARAKAEAANSGGDIRIVEAGGDVVASTSSGSIKLSNVKGNVEVKDSGGDINIDSANGNVTASTSSGSIHLGSAGGEHVTLRDSGGNIETGEAAGTVTLETSSGSIKVKSARGELIARDSGGDIVIGDAGSGVTAQTSSGSIRINKARGVLELRNSGGDVIVQDAGSNAALSTSSGSIHVVRARGKVDAKDSGGNIVIGEAQDMVLARTSSGEITVNFSVAPKSESRLEVSGGGVKVGLPRGAGLDIDAQSSGGNVVSSIAITTAVSGPTRRSAVQGKINGGGSILVLRSSSGDIRISETATLKAEAEK